MPRSMAAARTICRAGGVTISAVRFIGNNAPAEGRAFYNDRAHPHIVNSEFAGKLRWSEERRNIQ